MPDGRPIAESTIDVDGVEVFVRRTEGEGTPAVLFHGNPTDSRDWIPFIERTRRPSIALDCPGWGRSEAPSPDRFDYSMHGLARFFGRALDVLGIERHALVVHDWGALALIDAITRPQRLERLVVIDAVALLPGYRWHWLARLWRTRGVGPVANAIVTRRGVRFLSRFGPGDDPALPGWFADQVADAWRGTSSRAMLRLYRSADPAVLAAAGHGLGRLACPSLVVWGARDPYIPARFGRMYAKRLPNAELLELPDAGHWPWIERADLVETVVRFLDRG